MLSGFKSVVLSHKNAPVHVREAFALSESECRLLLSDIRNITGIRELLILSTCNRTEIYYVSEEDRSKDIVKLLALQKGITRFEHFIPYFLFITEQNEAVHHLFEVAAGLDAHVTGDLQIAGQVKEAYRRSAEADAAGPLLHRLMHSVFYANKRIVQETSFRDGAASVAYAVSEMTGELTAHFAEPSILIVGLGETGTDVCKNLHEAGQRNIYLCNRTFEKAQALAEEFGLSAVRFSDLNDAACKADVIISAATTDRVLIDRHTFKNDCALSFRYIFDLSVPRSVDPTVEDMPGIVLYNIDEIQNKTSEVLKKRLEAIPKVRAIIEEVIADFNDWTREMLISPAINRFKEVLEQIRKEELTRFMKDISSEEGKRMEEITRNILQKIIKLPAVQLKAACKRGEAEELIGMLTDLFDLEKKRDKKGDFRSV